MSQNERLGADGTVEDDFVHGERAEMRKVYPGEGQPGRGAKKSFVVQSELCEGVLHWGEDHVGEDVSPGLQPAINRRDLTRVEVRKQGQLEVPQALQDGLKGGQI